MVGFSMRASLRVGGRESQSFRAIAGIAPDYGMGAPFEAALRRMKGIVQGGVEVDVMIVRDDDFAARHLDVEAHHEFLALVLVPRGDFDHHAAADDLAVIAVELG